jgi:hypothetical protein
MPISRDEFEKGKIDPTLYAVLLFLESSADTAYTLGELLTELKSEGLSLSEKDLVSILNSLKARRRVESKTIDDVVYYIYRRTIGFRLS